MNRFKFTQSTSETIERILEGNRFKDIAVSGEGLSSLRGILGHTGRLATMGDDEQRSLWVEIPDRGGKVHWYRIFTFKTYDGFIGLLITDGIWNSVTFCNDTGRGTTEANKREDALVRKMLTDIGRLVDLILTDPQKYNRHVEECLPKQLRVGRIPRRELEAMVPGFDLNLTDPDITREALTAVRDGRTPALSTMTIREFCHWYRVAFLAFNKTGYEMTPADDDMDFYETHCFCNLHGVTNMGYDPDSEKDFIEFAKDHYGEIGLTRCDVRGIRVSDGWKILVDASYYAYTGGLLDMIGALFKAGAPLQVRDPERLLAVVDKTDWFAIKPNTFHDYWSYDDPGCGGSLTLPFEDEIPATDADSAKDGWTKARLGAVIAAAEWKPIPRVRPIEACGPDNGGNV